MLLAAALAVGALVGFIAGLTGIGGGVLMVPFLYVLYDRLGIAPAVATPVAHATSLAVIVPVAVRALIKYQGSGAVQWRAALPMALAGALAAAVVAPLVTHVPANALRLGFGVFLVVIALDLLMLRGATVEHVPEARRRHLVGAALIGLPVGALSATLGIGGGVPASAGMHYLLKLPFRVIAATSLAVVLFAAVAGSVSYLFTPSELAGSRWVVGHVDLEHGLPLAVGAVLAAPLGVSVNRRAPVATLRRVFGGLLLLTGVLLIIQNT